MLTAGVVLGDRYRLDERVATGGMGTVWRATDTMLERQVAVKVLLPSLVADPEFSVRFRAEARMMASLRHPGIVQIHDVGQAPLADGSQVSYLVMEYVAGEPLTARVGRAGRLDPASTMSIVAQAAEALHAAHTAGIVHRDVKPGNLLVKPDGSVVLVDFGIARSTTMAGITAAHTILGTASYLSPEQASGQPVSAASDVYALGAVAWFCLAGRPPFTGDSPLQIAMRHVQDPPPPLPPGTPAAVAEVVGRALAKRPADRHPSAADFAVAARDAREATLSPGAAAPPAGTTGYGRNGPVYGAPPTVPTSGAPVPPPAPGSGRPATPYPPGAPVPPPPGAFPAAGPQVPSPGTFPTGGPPVASPGTFPTGGTAVPPPGAYPSGRPALPPPRPTPSGAGGAPGGPPEDPPGSGPDRRVRAALVTAGGAALFALVVLVAVTALRPATDPGPPAGQAAPLETGSASTRAADPGGRAPTAGVTQAPVDAPTRSATPSPATTGPTGATTAPPTVGTTARPTPATTTTAPARPNPYTAQQVCGSGYSIIDSATLTAPDGTRQGRVHLLWNAGNGNNCVVTMKEASVGTATAVSAVLEVQGGSRRSDSGSFEYYAGPVRASAAGTCVKWGGSAGGASYLSSFEHCD